jgi:elongator complex protein 1
MKNLVVAACRSTGIVHLSGTACITDFCVQSSEKLYLASSDGRLTCFCIKTLKELWHVGFCPSECDGMHITGISFSLELDSVCLSLSSGSLILVNVESHEVEEAGSVEGGIVTMEWSPDGEVLALITGSGSLLIMNQVIHYSLRN